MNRYLQHPLGPPVAVLAALVVVLGLAQLTWRTQAGAQPTRESGQAPIGQTTRVCPEPSGSRVTVVSPPGENSSGRATIRTSGEKGQARRLGTVTRRGAIWTEELGASAPATVVHARGSVAAGLEVEQLATPATGGVQDLSGLRCTRPGTNFWFVTDGVALGRSTVLYLVNVDDRPVSVDVNAYGGNGPVTPAAGRGITVAAHSRTSVPLAALAPTAPQAALHVRTRGGRVLAALRTQTKGGQTASGADWVPHTQAPRRKLVVPGLAKGSGPRRLLLAAPGNSPARVQVQLVTTAGTYELDDAGALRVPPRSVVSVNLAEELSKRAAAVRISADVPVTAAAAVGTKGGLAYVSAVPPLDGGAVVGGGGLGGDRSGSVVQSAPYQTGGVKVTLIRPDGTVAGSEEVRIPAGRTVAADLSPSAVAGLESTAANDAEDFAVVVTPSRDLGPVYGARVLRQQSGGRTLVTSLPLRTSRTSVSVPDAEQSLGVVFPGS